MLSKIPQSYLEQLTVREIEEILEHKRKNRALAELLRERDRLRLELRHVEDEIEAVEKAHRRQDASGEIPTGGRRSPDGDGAVGAGRVGGARGGAPASFAVGSGPEPLVDGDGPRSFLAGKRKKNLKDYIAQVLLEAGEPLSPSDIQRRLPGVGYTSSSTNPRSFYNTVFQALQRYDIFTKEHKKYRLTDGAVKEDGVREILPKHKTRLKDYIIEVLDQSESPLKVSEIASRVVIAGYDTDLEMDELNQRVSATLKKYLNKDFDWDSQRYKLTTRTS